MTVVDAVLTTIATMAENPTASEAEIVLRLIDLGYDELQAEKLMIFVPLGLARALIARLGADPPVQLSDTALIRDGTMDRVLQLDNVPEFVTALQLAEETFISGIIPRDEFTAACTYSVELNLLNQALNAGSPIGGAVVSPPVLLRLADAAGFEEWYRSVVDK